ncbi:hypothetical protein DGMP_31570 [Desulfomarina profundi]|uniref:Uncharacterized protein n=1 Tax=Desulfomarina profundi TaxID=2772557 RepID=A0A8D5JIA3_9BACT|nr:hypothetical protein DGMP_31570 [Desulfomarina profundi]
MVVNQDFFGEFEVSFIQVFKKTLEYQMMKKNREVIFLKARKNGLFGLVKDLRKNHLKLFEKSLTSHLNCCDVYFCLQSFKTGQNV